MAIKPSEDSGEETASIAAAAVTRDTSGDAEKKRSPEEQAAYQADKLKKAMELLSANDIETSGLTKNQIFNRVRRYHKQQRFEAAEKASALKQI